MQNVGANAINSYSPLDCSRISTGKNTELLQQSSRTSKMRADIFHNFYALLGTLYNADCKTR